MTDLVRPAATGTLHPPEVPGYLLGQPIGRGATSVVWSATRASGGQVRAVKVSSPERRHPAEVMSVATREMAILERVRSEHVIRLHEVVPLADGALALVLDLAAAGSLAELVAGRGRLGPGEAVTVFSPLASTLAELHRAGAIHADLAPGNILFTHEGKPMLSDFGAARLVGEQDPQMVAGTPGFVAPEVARGGLATEASDVYGLGALAWFALTGSVAPAAVTVGDAADVLGERLGPVVAGLLDPDPGRRPAAAEAARQLFLAETAVPVVLDRRADPAHSITHRIRVEAAERHTTPPVKRRLGGPRRARLAPLAPLTVVLVAVVLAAGALAVVGGLGRAPAGAAVTASRSAPASALSAGAGETAPATTSPAGSADGRSAVRADPRAVLQGLLDARTEALLALDKAALGRSDAPGLPAYEADAALVDQMAAARLRYAGLAYQVRAAEWAGGDEGSAQVRVVLDRSAFRVVGPGTVAEDYPAQPGRELLYALAFTDQGWRIAAIR